MSLFGTASSATPLFGTASATTTKPLFGSTTAPASGGLFGSTTTQPTSTASGTLFGSTAAAPTTTSSLGLFGSSNTTTSTPSLFGSTSTAAPASTGSLFGTSATTSTLSGLGGTTTFGATTTAPVVTTSIFDTTSKPASTTLGLGGVQQQKSLTTTTGSTTGTSLTIGEKEGSKDGEILAAGHIREMLPLFEEKLRKNREIIEDVEKTSVEYFTSIDETIDKTRTWMNDVRRNVREGTDMSQYASRLVAEDKLFLDTTKRLQESATTSNQATLNNTIKRHLFEITDNYDSQMGEMQQRVEGIRSKFEKLLNGEAALSMEELDGLFRRCDQSYANAQFHIHETGRDIESLKNHLIEQGYTHLRKSYSTYSSKDKISENEGSEFFPSQSSLAIIGSSLRTPAAAAAPVVGGLGLGTGTSLFSSNTGTSLFGAPAAKQPAFSGGSLFGNISNTTSTAAPATTTSSLFPSFGSKPTTTFASTLSNNSSGLLFSTKK